jgi:hypothetical protein
MYDFWVAFASRPVPYKCFAASAANNCFHSLGIKERARNNFPI